MKHTRQLGLAALLLLGTCAPAWAQTRVVTISAPTTVTRGTTLTSTATTSAATLTGAYPVPGLGFDFSHHAAVNRDLATRALIDPVTQHQLAQARQIRRESPVVVTPLLPVINNTIVIVQSPPVIVQSPPPTVIIQQVHGSAAIADGATREPVVGEPAPQPPHRELEAIIFVRLDGMLLSAVGYAQRGDRIIYVTPQGARRSVAVEELDLEFTLRLNEERGTILNIS